MKAFIIAFLYLSTAVCHFASEPLQAAQASQSSKSDSNGASAEQDAAKPPPVNDEDLRAGMQYFRERRYATAISALSRYSTIAPKNPQRSAALLIIGKSLEELNQHLSALNVYGRLTEEDTESPESQLGMIAMADIGVSRPELKYRSAKKWSLYFTDPVKTYELVLAKKILPLSMVEHVSYQRGRALWKAMRYNDARIAMADFLKLYPQTAYRDEISRIIYECTAFAIDQFHQAGDDLAVADVFLQSWKEGFIRMTDVDTLLKSALSLSRVELHEDSLKLLGALRKNPSGLPPGSIQKIDAMTAEIEKMSKLERQEQPVIDPRWTQLQTARDQLASNKRNVAEQTLTEIRGTGADLFWVKIAEYALDERRLAEMMRSRKK